ncbi:unnamed protein product [Closterium sp. Yama58-4]|nr:unnamed protein product [Closterium sp. Yama58-4]
MLLDNSPAVVSHRRSLSHPLSESSSTNANQVSVTRQARAGKPDGRSSASQSELPVISRPADTANGKRSIRRNGPLRPFHAAMTCDSSGYSKWQSRVMYFYYKKWQREPGGEEMGGFTRVLHTGKEDELVEEIPTFVVNPLPPQQQTDYVVLNRPYAFVQWIQQATFPEDYVWMAEPDHLILRPIPNLSVGDMPSAFPFHYIEPAKNKEALHRWFPPEKGPINKIDPIGNSPVIIHKHLLRRLAPLWHNVTLEMKSDPVADKAFGWVLEMYGYATSAALLGIQHTLHRMWMIQPPWDAEPGDSYLIHYTYGCDFDLNGKMTPGVVGPWHFDKRDFNTAPPRNLSLPPKGAAPSVFKLVSMINDATWSIPNWRAGAP